MCKHLDRLDVGADDFIWHQNGVYSTVSLGEAARLQAEDKLIYVAAALEHPWMQVARRHLELVAAARVHHLARIQDSIFWVCRRHQSA
jgi:hypothetical protein